MSWQGDSKTQDIALCMVWIWKDLCVWRDSNFDKLSAMTKGLDKSVLEPWYLMKKLPEVSSMRWN